MYRVLVVEDDPSMGKVLLYKFKTCGLDVLVAKNGLEAWEILEKGVFDAIVVDYMLPKLNGLELLERVRQEPRHAQTPVILITAKFLELDIANLMEAFHLSAAFCKPFSPAMLARVLLEELPPPPQPPASDLALEPALC